MKSNLHDNGEERANEYSLCHKHIYHIYQMKITTEPTHYESHFVSRKPDMTVELNLEDPIRRYGSDRGENRGERNCCPDIVLVKGNLYLLITH